MATAFFLQSTLDYRGHACERLPLALKACPTCGVATKSTKKFAWIAKDRAFAFAAPCANTASCQACPICKPALLKIDAPGDRTGLLWVAGSAAGQTQLWRIPGTPILHPIPAPPRGVVIGATRVFVAHPYAVAPQGRLFQDEAPLDRETADAGIIGHFVVQGIRAEVDGLSSKETDRLVKRGFTVVSMDRPVPVDEDPVPEPANG